jgi:lipopolysaccharide/colanic/teichoic acid biosynthesis glycosyltransferase
MPQKNSNVFEGDVAAFGQAAPQSVTHEKGHSENSATISTPQIGHPLSARPSRFQTAHNPLPAWKRGLDLTCLLLISPVVVPLMALTALLVRLSSPGPVLFRQARIGLYGERFVCLKFRTMFVAAATDTHQAHLANLMNSDQPMTKLDLVDSRIIPLGMLLRSTGLDELPQLINVLRGEMSLVGPRPCLPYEVEKFKAADSRRFDALPGLTGLWQVSGKNKTTFQEMIRLDVEYAQTLSLWEDLRIMTCTFPVLVDQTLVVVRNKWRRLTKSGPKQETAV